MPTAGGERNRTGGRKRRTTGRQWEAIMKEEHDGGQRLAETKRNGIEVEGKGRESNGGTELKVQEKRQGD